MDIHEDDRRAIFFIPEQGLFIWVTINEKIRHYDYEGGSPIDALDTGTRVDVLNMLLLAVKPEITREISDAVKAVSECQVEAETPAERAAAAAVIETLTIRLDEADAEFVRERARERAAWEEKAAGPDSQALFIRGPFPADGPTGPSA